LEVQAGAPSPGKRTSLWVEVRKCYGQILSNELSGPATGHVDGEAYPRRPKEEEAALATAMLFPDSDSVTDAICRVPIGNNRKR